MKRFLIVACACAAIAATPQDISTQVRAWRVEHEKPILLDLFAFLSIPNVASNPADIQRNADALVRMFGVASLRAGDHRDLRLAARARRAPIAGRAARSFYFTTTASRSDPRVDVQAAPASGRAPHEPRAARSR
jgi:hypothetical protein